VVTIKTPIVYKDRKKGNTKEKGGRRENEEKSSRKSAELH